MRSAASRNVCDAFAQRIHAYLLCNTYRYLWYYPKPIIEVVVYSQPFMTCCMSLFCTALRRLGSQHQHTGGYCNLYTGPQCQLSMHALAFGRASAEPFLNGAQGQGVEQQVVQGKCIVPGHWLHRIFTVLLLVLKQRLINQLLPQLILHVHVFLHCSKHPAGHQHDQSSQDESDSLLRGLCKMQPTAVQQVHQPKVIR